MATNDPKSRLNEGALNSPSFPSPNGVTEQRADLGTTGGTTATQPQVGRPAEETPGEKIGRFFRHAMERLSGHDENEWKRGNERNERDRDTQDRYRSGDRSWQYGRSALRDQRDQNEWRDLGRSRDDRNLSDRRGSIGETGSSYGQGSSSGQGVYASQGRSGGQGGYGQGASGAQRAYERDENRPGSGQGPSFENRGQSLGQRSLGKSPSESYGMSEVPDDRRQS
ncbi:MAG TPA: hypothetical protein VGF31_07890, partial [Myxococcaceae bacterium]